MIIPDEKARATTTTTKLSHNSKGKIGVLFPPNFLTIAKVFQRLMIYTWIKTIKREKIYLIH
jgi:hypothetical protein